MLGEMTPSRIQAYFRPIGKKLFQLSGSIQKYVKFTTHDLKKPPPSTGFDLISCRNVLIYFSRKEGDKLLQRFHTALRDGGYLVLGKSEVLPVKLRPLFKIIDTRARIYQRCDG